jgi:RimJ/RimL family protein N-acetyltransferase
MNFPEDFPVLTTPRLVLRATAPQDVEGVFSMESDPVAMRYWSRPPMQDIAEAHAAVERAMTFFPARVGIRWAITRAGDDRLIGHVSVFGFHEPSDRGEIGYGLLRARWGQGLMHEALIAVVDYAFGPLGLRRLEADIHPGNLASLRSVERLGFAREGFLRERWQVGDEISDSVLLGLLAREWRERRAAETTAS